MCHDQPLTRAISVPVLSHIILFLLLLVLHAQLYNEEIRDLLNPGASSGSGPGLDLREDPTRGPVVAGVTEVPTKSADQVMALVHAGNGRRRTEGTAANPVSSRSHAVLQVLL